jgi:hypothetical protein
VDSREHWICFAHRRERGLGFLARAGPETSEGAVLGELVFTFPSTCASVEHFLGHFYAVTRCWTTTAPWRIVLKQHSLLRKLHVRESMSREEVTEFVARFSTFVIRHARAYGWTRLVYTCADRVAEWYPVLVPSGPIDAIIGSERMLACLPARSRPYIVFAEVERALRGILSHDAIECVFLQYIHLIRKSDSYVGGFRFGLITP